MRWGPVGQVLRELRRGGRGRASLVLVLLVSPWRCPGMAGPASCPCAHQSWAG